MTTTLPMRLQLWQSEGEIIPTGSPSGMISPLSDTHTHTHSLSISTSPTLTPTSELSPCGTFDLIKSKSVLHSKSHKNLPYPTHVESTPTPTSQPNIRRVVSLMNLPSLENRHIHTAYTPPSATRTLPSSPSWENLIQAHQQRMIDLRADQHRRRYRGITPASYLYTGAYYKGYQSVHHSGRDLSWNVSVRVLGLDLRHGVCCGMMEARDIPGQKPGTVTTYWEGQIVDNINHCFFTGRWGTTCQQDENQWCKFVAYIPLRHLVTNQQPLVQTCYPVDGQPNGMNKPDEHTADRIYAKLQQLKRLAQQPPPRMESCIEEMDTLSLSQEDHSLPNTCEETEEPEPEPEVQHDTEPQHESEPEHETHPNHEHLSESDSSEPVIQEDIEESCGYDEFASIASHHRLTRHLNRSQYIFMRWKEMSFDEQDQAKGFTIAGFYYVVMDRKDGSIIGIFQDQRSTCSQRLILRHINHESSNMGQSFSEYHFH